MLVTDTIPIQTGGISQQPDHERALNQATRMVNLLPDPVLGVVTRPGLNLVALLDSALTLPARTFYHMLTDYDREYLLALSPTESYLGARPRVFDLEGIEYPVEQPSAVVPEGAEWGEEGFYDTYPIGDGEVKEFTGTMGTTHYTCVNDGDFSLSDDAVSIPPSYTLHYLTCTAGAGSSQVEELVMEDVLLSDETSLEAYQITGIEVLLYLNGGGGSGIGLYAQIKDVTTEQLVIDDGSVTPHAYSVSWTGEWTQEDFQAPVLRLRFTASTGGSVNVSSVKVRYTARRATKVTTAIQEAEPVSAFKCLTIGNRTYVLNTNTKVAMLPNPGTTSRAVGYVDPDLAVAVVLKNAAFDTTYYLKFRGLEVSYTTPNTGEVSIESILDNLIIEVIDAFNMGDPPPTSINPYGGIKVPTSPPWQPPGVNPDDLFYHRVGNTLYLYARTVENRDTITVRDSRGSTDTFFTVRREVQQFTDLPIYGHDGDTVRVLNSDQVVSTDFFVKFRITERTVQDGFPDVGRGVWEETRIPNASAPTLDHDLDKTTLPLVLTRGTRPEYVTDANPTGTYFSLDYSNDWVGRQVGDGETSPAPSFVGNTIQDLFLFRGRLGFISNGNIIMSVTNDLQCFWRKTTQQVTDDDPIDVHYAHPKIWSLRHAVPIGGELALFGDHVQMVLSGGEALTPRTANITITSEFDCHPTVEPQVAGPSIFWVHRQGQFTAAREALRTAQGISHGSLTTPIPTLISGNPKVLATSPEGYVMLSTGNEHLYVYRFVRNGQRSFTAWTDWVFPIGKIRFARFVNTTLHLIVQDDAGKFVGLCNMDLHQPFDPNNYSLRADFLAEVGSTVVQSFMGNEPTVQYECDFAGHAHGIFFSDKPIVAASCIEDGESTTAAFYYEIASRDELGITFADETLTFSEDLWFGYPIQTELKYSKINVRANDHAGGSVGVLDRALTVKWVSTEIHGKGTDSSLTVSRLNRSTETVTLTTNDSPNHPLTVTKVRIGEMSHNLDLTITSTGFMPIGIGPLEWRGDWQPKARRL